MNLQQKFDNIDLHERPKILAYYMLNNNATIRQTAEFFKMSNSTVHHDLSKKLKVIDPILYLVVQDHLDKNSANKYRRGGLATKRKYENLKKAKTKIKKDSWY